MAETLPTSKPTLFSLTIFWSQTLRFLCHAIQISYCKLISVSGLANFLYTSQFPRLLFARSLASASLKEGKKNNDDCPLFLQRQLSASLFEEFQLNRPRSWNFWLPWSRLLDPTPPWNSGAKLSGKDTWDAARCRGRSKRDFPFTRSKKMAQCKKTSIKIAVLDGEGRGGEDSRGQSSKRERLQVLSGEITTDSRRKRYD